MVIPDYTSVAPAVQIATCLGYVILFISFAAKNDDMIKKFTCSAALLLTFLLGYGFCRITFTRGQPRITGIGGIFFRAKDPKKLKEWYAAHFGMKMEQSGTSFEWHQGVDSTKKGFTLWVPFKESTRYFPPEKQFMITTA